MAYETGSRALDYALGLGQFAPVPEEIPVPEQPARGLPALAPTGKIPSGAEHYADMVQTIADKYGVPFERMMGLIKTESAFRPQARSPVGAMGLMQLMPGTARDLGVADPNDPAQNIEGGVKYYSQLLKQFSGDHEKATMAYNWGPGNVQKFLQGKIHSIPAETRGHLAATNANARLFGARPAEETPEGTPQPEAPKIPEGYRQVLLTNGETAYVNPKYNDEQVAAQLKAKGVKAEPTRQIMVGEQPVHVRYNMPEEEMLTKVREQIASGVIPDPNADKGLVSSFQSGLHSLSGNIAMGMGDTEAAKKEYAEAKALEADPRYASWMGRNITHPLAAGLAENLPATLSALGPVGAALGAGAMYVPERGKLLHRAEEEGKTLSPTAEYGTPAVNALLDIAGVGPMGLGRKLPGAVLGYGADVATNVAGNVAQEVATQEALGNELDNEELLKIAGQSVAPAAVLAGLPYAGRGVAKGLEGLKSEPTPEAPTPEAPTPEAPTPEAPTPESLHPEVDDAVNIEEPSQVVRDGSAQPEEIQAVGDQAIPSEGMEPSRQGEGEPQEVQQVAPEEQAVETGEIGEAPSALHKQAEERPLVDRIKEVLAKPGEKLGDLRRQLVDKTDPLTKRFSELPEYVEELGKFRADKQAKEAYRAAQHVQQAQATGDIPELKRGLVTFKKGKSLDYFANKADKLLKDIGGRKAWADLIITLDGEAQLKKDKAKFAVYDSLIKQGKEEQAYKFAKSKGLDVDERKGAERLVTPEHIQWKNKVLSKYGEPLKKLIKERDEQRHGMVDFLVDSGRISKEVGQDWKDNPYVYRGLSFEDIEAMGHVSRGYVPTASEARKFKSRERSEHLVNFWENEARMYPNLMVPALQNNARLGLAETLMKEKVDELKAANPKLTNEEAEKQAFNELHTYPSTDSTMKYFKNGEELNIKLDDPLVHETMAFTNPAQSALGKLVSPVSRLQRAMYLSKPGVWAKQHLLDPTLNQVLIGAPISKGAGITSPVHSIYHNATLAANALSKAVGGKDLRSQSLKELEEHGVHVPRDELDRVLDLAKDKKQPAYIPVAVKNVASKAVNALNKIHTSVDKSIKAEYYRLFKLKGQEMGLKGDELKQWAAMKAEELVDFNNRGANEAMGELRQHVLFMSTAINELDAIYRGMSGHGLPKAEKAKHKARVRKYAATIMSSMMLYEAYKSLTDPDYLKEDDEEKLRSISIGDYRYPVAWGMGEMLVTMPRAAMRAILNASGARAPGATATESGKAFLQSVWDNVVPPMMPTATRPLLETVTNRNMFTGEPLVPTSEEGLPVEAQGKNALPMTRWLADMSGMAPQKVEALMRGYLGVAYDAVNAALDQWGEPTVKGKSAMESPIAKTLGLSQFVKPTEKTSGQGRFYDYMKQTQEAAAGVTSLNKRDLKEKANAFFEKNRDLVGHAKAFKQISEDIAAVNTRIEQLRNSRFFKTEDARERAIKQMVNEKQRLIDAGNSMAERMNKKGGD